MLPLILSELLVLQLPHQWVFLILPFRFWDIGRVMPTIDTYGYQATRIANVGSIG